MTDEERQNRLTIIRAKINAAADDPERITDERLGHHFANRLEAFRGETAKKG